jgi:hypothetical protein
MAEIDVFFFQKFPSITFPYPPSFCFSWLGYLGDGAVGDWHPHLLPKLEKPTRATTPSRRHITPMLLSSFPAVIPFCNKHDRDPAIPVSIKDKSIAELPEGGLDNPNQGIIVLLHEHAKGDWQAGRRGRSSCRWVAIGLVGWRWQHDVWVRWRWGLWW